MPTKPKTNQPQTPDKVQERDFFETPRYATEMLVSFIPYSVKAIWECACGNGRMSNVFSDKKYYVFSSDIVSDYNPRYGKRFGWNFLSDDLKIQTDVLNEIKIDGNGSVAIITNPPFSLKEKFYKRCLQYKQYDIPFALLIPADYSGWVVRALKDDGAEKIIPERRIDYITPNVIENIWKGQTKKLIEIETRTKYKNWKLVPDEIKDKYLYRIDKYKKVGDIPNNVLAKYSASQFHSLWLTCGFGIGKSETFVPLTKQMKENIL